MPTPRRARRALALTVSTGLAGAVGTAVMWLGAAPASADVPLGWSDPAPVDKLHAILLLGGVPLLLFVLIALAVYLPALARGERVAPGASPVEDQWLGGPRQVRELAVGDPEQRDETGGARGGW